jgi:hypothetical protein
MLIIGWVCSSRMPVISFVFGIIVTAKNRAEHSAGIMAESTLASAVLVAIFWTILSD